jgi:hypothetical protein
MTLIKKNTEVSPRAIETTWRRIGELLQALTLREYSNYFRNAG